VSVTAGKLGNRPLDRRLMLQLSMQPLDPRHSGCVTLALTADRFGIGQSLITVYRRHRALEEAAKPLFVERPAPSKE